MPAPLFKPGNKAAAGHGPWKKNYARECQRFMEEEGWQILIKWSKSYDSDVSIKATALLAAYGYGKPREQIRIQGEMAFNIQEWFLQHRKGNSLPPEPSPVVPPGMPEEPEVVRGPSAGSRDVGKANRDTGKRT